MTPTEQPILPPIGADQRRYMESQLTDALCRFAAYTAEINTSKGFCTSPPANTTEIIAQIMLVVTELSEAVEGLRKDLMDDKVPSRRMVEVELADALIRLLNISQWCGYDIAGAAIEKSRYNETRPYRHGNKAL